MITASGHMEGDMAHPVRTFRFRRQDRLKGRDMADLLFSQGLTFYQYPFKVFYLIHDHGAPVKCQLLVTVSKRNLRHAVDRNLIKRRMREAYRLNRHVLETTDGKPGPKILLGLVYTGRGIAGFEEIRNKIILVLKRLSQLDEVAAQ